MASKGFFSTYGTSVQDLEAAQKARLYEAEALLGVKQFAGVILAGHLAVEIAIKLFICRTRNVGHLQSPYQSHDLRELLHAAGLFDEATKGANPWPKEGYTRYGRTGPSFPNYVDNWKIVLEFTEALIVALRYTDPAIVKEAKAKRHFDAVRLPPHGVIPWLEQRR
jgi:hypothetical protein